MQENPEDCVGEKIPNTEWVYKRVPTQNVTDIFNKYPEEGPPFTYVPPGVFQYKENKPAFNTRISVNWPSCPTCGSTAVPEDVIPTQHKVTDKFRIIRGKVDEIKKGKGVNKVVHNPCPYNEAHGLICIKPYDIDKEEYLDVRQDLAENFELYTPEKINDEENEIFSEIEE